MDHARKLRALALGRCLRVGDAVLTGGDDPVSTIIQTGSRSPYSHIGVVVGPGLVVEAYDYALTPDETDEGVFIIALDDFLDRCSHLRAVEVRRPLHIDRGRLVAAAHHLEDHSPGFPTLGMACLALCGLSDPLLGVLPGGIGRRLATALASVAADGVWAVHCAETATRLYHAAGVPLRFRSPRLWPHLVALQSLQDRPGGQAQPPLVDLPTSRRQAAEGCWPRGLRLAPYAVAATVRAVGYRARRAWRDETQGDRAWRDGASVVGADHGRGASRAPESGDVADLILPGDFARADPFELVGRYRRQADRWVEVTPSGGAVVHTPSEQLRPAVARRMYRNPIPTPAA